MITQLNDKQPSLVKEDRTRSAAISADNDGYKLHLALDKQSYARLLWLQGALKAASIGEVFRRAFDAYEIFEPEDIARHEGVPDHTIAPARNRAVKHLYVIISNEMKQQLDEEKSAHGRAYKETTRRALSVLTQLIRERAKLIEKTIHGDKDALHQSKKCKDITPSILATI